jgi:hypothetical protein
MRDAASLAFVVWMKPDSSASFCFYGASASLRFYGISAGPAALPSSADAGMIGSV